MTRKAVVFSALLISSFPAFGAINSYNFSNTDSLVSEMNPFGFTPGSLTNSPGFSGSFSYSDDVSVLESVSNRTLYSTDYLEFEVTFESGEQALFSGSQIAVINNYMIDGVINDYTIFLFDTVISSDLNIGAESNKVSLFFFDDSATAPTTNNLLSSFDPHTFNNRYFVWESIDQGLDEAYWIKGDLTSITEVPVPTAAWLFGSALLGLAGIRKKT